jgi:hypothetical protein
LRARSVVGDEKHDIAQRLWPVGRSHVGDWRCVARAYNEVS